MSNSTSTTPLLASQREDQLSVIREASPLVPPGTTTTTTTTEGLLYKTLDEQITKSFKSYSIDVDPNQNDKATEIRLCSTARPHMRAFHCSWWGFFIGSFAWYSITPLLSEVQESLDISKQMIWTSSICMVVSTIFLRFLLGPLCDKFGPRVTFGIILMTSAIPVACTGFVQTGVGLCVLRFFIGIAGSTFIPSSYWTTQMFTKEVVGTANGIVAGWGNLGGGITQLVMGSMLFPVFKNIIFNGNADMAWRTVCIVPAVISFISGVVILQVSDDSPMGNIRSSSKKKKKNNSQRNDVNMGKSFLQGARNYNTWIIAFQYACCSGVENCVNNAAALYFKNAFGQSTEDAAAIASLFGWMNLFARAMGGVWSDSANQQFGMRGRLWMQMFILFFEGLSLLFFVHSPSLPRAIVMLMIFSVFVQAAEGSTFGIVPYVDPRISGSISGIVGAGGNTGAAMFGLGFRQLPARSAFTLMGITIIMASLLCTVIDIQGHSNLFFSESDIMDPSPRRNNDKQDNDDDDEEEQGLPRGYGSTTSTILETPPASP